MSKFIKIAANIGALLPVLVNVARIRTVRPTRKQDKYSQYPRDVIVYGPNVEIVLDDGSVIITKMTLEEVEQML